RIDNGKLPGNITKDTSIVSREEQVSAVIVYYKQANKLDSVWSWQNHLGIIKLLKGEHQAARDLFAAVLKEYQYLSNESKSIAILNNLAILENNAQKYEASLRYYDELIQLAKA